MSTAGCAGANDVRALTGAEGPAATPAEARLACLLRVLAAVFALATLCYLGASLVRPWQGFVHHLPFVSNSVVKVAILAMCCLLASGDPRRRRGLVHVVLLAHAISIGAMAAFLVGVDVGRDTPLGVPIGTALWAAIALDGVILGLLLACHLAARRPTEPTPADHQEPTAAEKRLRLFVQLAGAAFAVAAVLYEIGPFLAATRQVCRELPFVSNSVVKVSTLSMLCFLAARDLERHAALLDVLFVAHVVSGLAMIVMFAAADTSAVVPFAGSEVTVRSLLWAAIALDLAIAAAFFVLTAKAWRARWRLVFFRPIEFRALVSLADVLVAGPAHEELVPAEEVAQRVEHYMSRIRARRRWLFRVALFGMQLAPLLRLRAPLSELAAAERRRLLRTSFGYDGTPGRARFVRGLVQAAIRIGKQLAYVGYYSDPRTFDSVGYRTFSARCQAANQPVPPHADPRLDVLPGREAPPVLSADVCIIGSGAAGAVLAHELAARGRDVLVLERGKLVRPSEFSENEVEMIGKLYADGIFQQTRDFRFTILQGSCVGGTTVVNNAVSFPPPTEVLARWNGPQIDAGLDLRELDQSTRHVWQWLEVGRQPADKLNPSGQLFHDAVERELRAEFTGGAPIVEANITGCHGCGYCNIGCAYGRKLSMLDHVLPQAQRTGRVRIVSDCEVVRIRTSTGKTRRAHDLIATVDGERPITVRAETYVLAAGAIASSWLLMRSGIAPGLPVGKRLSFNMGAYLTADLGRKIDSYAGLQISHYARSEDFVLETWWNPPVAQAINMPGWFEDHFANMRCYDRMMAVGVLVGTEGEAEVKRALTGGPDVTFTPDSEDRRKLVAGLRSCASILFRLGAKRVLANTWGKDEFVALDDSFDRFLARVARGDGYLALGTGHPQGGNAIGRNPARSVVDPSFRVHGYENLHVCDASVFPTSITVNPQITIMSLAHYAAPRIG